MCILGSATPPIPRERSSIASQFLGSPVLGLLPTTFKQNEQIRHDNTHNGEGMFLGQPRHCICTNASRGLSTTAEFVVLSISDNVHTLLLALLHILALELHLIVLLFLRCL